MHFTGKRDALMIPKNIRREDILSAIRQIDGEGVPKSRLSHTYYIRYNGKSYPPQYVVSLANNRVNGGELPPDEFNGGVETNSFLRELGFEIIPRQRASDINSVFSETKVITVTLQSNLCNYPKSKERFSLHE